MQKGSRGAWGIPVVGALLVVEGWRGDGSYLLSPALIAVGVALIAFWIYAPWRGIHERYLEAEAAAVRMNEAERAAPVTHEPVPHKHGHRKGREPWPLGIEARMAHLTFGHGAREEAEAARAVESWDWDDPDADDHEPLRLLHLRLHGLGY